jgi:NTP pyrophosphatase (non-canonical NTP hydrolase)
MEKIKYFKVALADGSTFVEGGAIDATEVKKNTCKKLKCSIEDVRVKPIEDFHGYMRKLQGNLKGKRKTSGNKFINTIRNYSPPTVKYGQMKSYAKKLLSQYTTQPTLLVPPADHKHVHHPDTMFNMAKNLYKRLMLSRKTLGLNKLARECHKTAKDHGFWAEGPQSQLEQADAACFALMHSEISEALEARRKPIDPAHPYEYITYQQPGRPDKPAGIAEEMADVIIRVLDFCGARHIDIDRAVREKMAYNKSRPYKHGKNF